MEKQEEGEHMRLDGFGIFVKDMGTMIRFYRDVLGFGIKENEESENVFLEKDGTLFLLYGRDGLEKMTGRRFCYADKVNGHFEIALTVSDYAAVDEAYNSVIEKGLCRSWHLLRNLGGSGPVMWLIRKAIWLRLGHLLRGNHKMDHSPVFKQVTLENLEAEHICCCISDKKGENCVSSKKSWLRNRMQEGLVFNKLDVRGKVFIEYLPAEFAWAPINADGYMYIDCLWVSGQYKGKGYGDQLLDQCIADSKAKGKRGLVCLSSKKKMPFLSDPGYLKHRGFKVADTASPYYEIVLSAFSDSETVPSIKDVAKNGCVDEKGLVLYYSDQCPHTSKYVPLLAGNLKELGLECRFRKIETKEDAQAAPVPFTTYALFYNGAFVTNEILSEKSFSKIWERIGNTQG